MPTNPQPDPLGGRAAVSRLGENEPLTEYFNWTAKCLVAAAADRTLFFGVNAIRGILLALDHRERATPSQGALDEVHAALAVAAPIIAAAADPMRPDHVIAGLAHVRSLLDLFGRDGQELLDERAWRAIQDDIDHSALIADELDAVYRRREIAARKAERPAAARSIH